jgi:transposase
MKKPAQRLIAEVPGRRSKAQLTIGIDLGDVWSHYCTLNEDGEVVDRGRFRTTPKAIEKWFTDVPPAQVAMEAGTHSIWISEQLQELGHEVIVANCAKSCGYRMPASSTRCFAKRSLAVMPPGLAQALGPVLEQIAAMTTKFKLYDHQIQQIGQTDYPETQALLKVPGVGHLTALTFVLTLGSKECFKQSRDVGCYLGLRPRRSQSGDRDPQLGITKAGNVYLR